MPMPVVSSKNHSNTKLFAILLVLILLGELGWRRQRLDTLQWNPDEGIHLMAARLAIAGHQPYSEIFFSQLPVFFEAVRVPLQWLGSVTAVRWSMSIFGLLALIAVALLGRRLGGNLAGLSAAIFLALTSSFFYYSRTVMADVPAVALGLWACWAAFVYRDEGRRRWLVASGILMGLSLATKFLTIYAVVWIGLLILQHRWLTSPSRSLNRAVITAAGYDGLIFGLTTLLTIAAILAWYSPASLLTDAFGMRAAMREVFGSATPLADDRDVFLEFWLLHAPLIILAGYGLAVQLRQRGRFWLLAAWPGLILLTLLNHTPLHRQHFQLLPPILAVLAGLSVGHLYQATRQALAQRIWQFRLWSLGGLILLVWYIGSIWLPVTSDNPYTTTSQPLNQSDQRLVDFLQRFTSPTDCLVTDDLTLAFLADRLVPPDLSDLSSARLRSGNLGYDELVTATEQYQCQVVAPIASRLKRSRSDYVEWAKAHFLSVWFYSEATDLGLWLSDEASEVLLAYPLASPQPQHARAATLADQVELVGYDLVQPTKTKSSPLYLSLYWRTLRPFSSEYTIFVHLRDGQNNTVVNADHQPYNNLVPTTRWPVGTTVKETIQLDLASELPVGRYRLAVGLYLPTTLERLAVQGDTSGENAIIIGPIEVIN